ncbi:MAG: redoxin domain-containing protein [Chloroflexi bacterium]|nr:redoxin domain-containing protein [Chloroflexota bacterium]
MENRRFEEKDTQVLGISCDSRPAQTAFAASLGGISYPLLSDFHPKGQVSEAFGVYNPERGNSRRSIIIIDKQGIVRYKRIYDRGLPDTNEVMAELEKL